MTTRSIRRGDHVQPKVARSLWAIAAPLVLGGLLLACGGQTGATAAGSGAGTSPVGSASTPSSPGVVVTSSAPGGAAIDPCALLTTDEVQSKSGATVSRTEKAATSCTWWLADDGGWIKLVINPIGRAVFDAALAQAQPVDGLGDKAFADGNTLVVLKGDTILELGSEIVLSNADPAVFTRPLMEAALARL